MDVGICNRHLGAPEAKVVLFFEQRMFLSCEMLMKLLDLSVFNACKQTLTTCSSRAEFTSSYLISHSHFVIFLIFSNHFTFFFTHFAISFLSIRPPFFLIIFCVKTNKGGVACMAGLKPPPDVLITHVCRLLLLCAGSCVLQRSESPVCSLDKVPQALACDWLLACLQVKTTNHQTAPCPDDSVPEFLPFCLFFSRNASFTRTHSRPCVSG